MKALRLWAGGIVVALAVAGCGSGSADNAGASKQTLAGLFRITTGACAGGTITGSWFRMVQPGGTAKSGPYVSNPDSPCPGHLVTVLSPGTDGGLRTGAFQPQPNPPFAAGGGSASAAVVKPQGFFAVAFGVSTNKRDPQTGKTVLAPSITRSGAVLSGNLSSWSVSWNGQQFNQGAPKPDGGTNASGTYDAGTNRYTLDWTSRIVGGPFNGFTGIWHLEGAYQAT